MNTPMRIQVSVEDGTASVSLGANLYVPERFEVTADDPALPYTVTSQVMLQQGRFVCDQLTVTRREGGGPVTSEGLRELPVAAVVGRGARALLLRMKTAGGELASYTVPERLADRGGPTAEALQAVTAVYRLAYATGEGPTRAVMQRLGLPRSTASRWIRMARGRGLLGPATQGKAGG